MDFPEAAGYDQSFDFDITLPPSIDNTNECYYPTDFIGKGHSAHVFRLKKLNNENTHFEPSNYVAKVSSVFIFSQLLKNFSF